MERREIKFRAWDKEKKMMISPLSTFIAPNGPGGEMRMDTPSQDDNYILMQYTDLKDDNGVEIYEGDIVAVDQKDFDVFNDENKYQVKWLGEEGYPAFDLFGWEGESCGLSEISQSGEYSYKVIGNIYENPGLLNP